MLYYDICKQEAKILCSTLPPHQFYYNIQGEETRSASTASDLLVRQGYWRLTYQAMFTLKGEKSVRWTLLEVLTEARVRC